MRDAFARQVDYLRLSITDRCNERCAYCMPVDHHDWLPRREILSYEEILRVVQVAVSLGFGKFRVTGGEPLVRCDVVPFIKHLAAVPGVRSLSMTTNATRLAPLAAPLRRAGMQRLNISLDALDPDVYHRITHGRLADALAGIDAACNAGFDSIKLNTVMLPNVTLDQLDALLDFAAARDLPLRFIELMPLSKADVIEGDNFLPAARVIDQLKARDELQPIDNPSLGHGPARYFRMSKRRVTVGFIRAITDEHFCETCNKMRLTPDGFIRPCLGNHGELDLKPALRQTADDADVDAAVRRVLEHALADKPAEHRFGDQYVPMRIMTAIGG